MRHLTIVVLVAACLPAFGVTAQEGKFPDWWPRIKGDARSFLPISLICPEDDGGVLELVSHKNAEYGYRLRVVYKNKKPHSFTLSKYENGSFKDTVAKRLPAEGFKGPKKLGNAIQKNVCRGSDAAQQKFADYLQANKDRLQRR
jgi:hypothetical protein